MPYAAIMYRVKPGMEDEIAQIFADFQRMNSPVFYRADGLEAGKLRGTAVFVKEDVVIRVIDYEGDFSALGRHIGSQQGVHLIEEKLEPVLAERRDTSSPETFPAYFANALMRCVSQLSLNTLPNWG